MKKIIAISFLSIFLYAYTELPQLLKLPVLVHHYIEHCQNEPNESFANFIHEHYTDNQNHSDNSHQDHQHLPFKTTDLATTNTTLPFSNPINFSFCHIQIPSIKITTTYSEEFNSSTIPNKVWQPPQFS